MSELIPASGLENVPATIRRERQELAQISNPKDALDAERRAGAIRELTRRARLPVPIQNEAKLYEEEASALVVALVDAGQKAGQIATAGKGKSNIARGDISPMVNLGDLGLTADQLAKKREKADAGVAAALRDAVESAPDKPVPAPAAIVKEHKKEQAQKAKDADRVKAAKLAQRPFAGRCSLLHGDLLEAGASIADGTIDAIATDPPYEKEFLPVWGALGELAARVLKPGGWLVAMAPHAHLPEVLQRLERDGLMYRWTIAYLMSSGESAQLQSLRLNIRWKPVLLYTAGTLRQMATYGSDIVANAVQDADRHDEGWGQGIDGFSKLVAGVTRADQLVLDPFLGSGTTAVAALTQGRRFVGIDVDKKYIDETWHRLGELQQ